MSWQALSWAGKIKVGSPAAKSLLILLANFADEAGECYPTYDKLSEMSELSYRAVQGNIAKLESLGLIERKRDRLPNGTLGVTRYRLCLHVLSVTTHRQEMPVAPPAADSGSPPADNSISHRQELPVNKEPPVEPNTTLNARARLDEIERELIAAAGPAIDPTAVSLLVLSDPLAWLDAGADLLLDVLPTIRARCSKARPRSIRSWAYFSQAIADARDRRMRGLPPAAEIVSLNREKRHGTPTTSDLLRAAAADLRAEAADGVDSGTRWDHARLLPGAG